ncbi:hypothetical protein [Algicola sagamiensis]|uniref:hypothetical protein n=1 Tax=Algicola sagamiensis TaxID=163869 RepID=UPI00035C3B96|nr:hypothetical protein [Algicola sagamiensis]
MRSDQWRRIFWVYLIGFLAVLGGTFIISGVGPLVYTSLGLILFALIPLYGYAYQRAIGPHWLAVVTFCICAMVAVIEFSWYSIELMFSMGQHYFIIAPLGIFIHIFILYPQYCYAFNCLHLWEEKCLNH